MRKSLSRKSRIEGVTPMGNRNATSTQIVLAILALLPYLLYLVLVSGFYSTWSDKQYHKAVYDAISSGASFGVLLGLLFPLILAWKREVTRRPLLIACLILLIIGIFFSAALFQGYRSIQQVIANHPNDSTRHHGELGGLYLSSYFSAFSLVFCLSGFTTAGCWRKKPAAIAPGKVVE